MGSDGQPPGHPLSERQRRAAPRCSWPRTSRRRSRPSPSACSPSGSTLAADSASRAGVKRRDPAAGDVEAQVAGGKHLVRAEIGVWPEGDLHQRPATHRGRRTPASHPVECRACGRCVPRCRAQRLPRARSSPCRQRSPPTAVHLLGESQIGRIGGYGEWRHLGRLEQRQLERRDLLAGDAAEGRRRRSLQNTMPGTLTPGPRETVSAERVVEGLSWVFGPSHNSTSRSPAGGSLTPMLPASIRTPRLSARLS